MSIVIKTEPNLVVEVSSDEDEIPDSSILNLQRLVIPTTNAPTITAPTVNEPAMIRLPNFLVPAYNESMRFARVPNTELRRRPPTPVDAQCAICLDDFTNKCHTDACWHLFCFPCLKRWSTSSTPFCPLCKKTYSLIFHSINDAEGVRETYNVRAQRALPILPPVRLLTDTPETRYLRFNMLMDIIRRRERNNMNLFERRGTDFDDSEITRFYEVFHNYPSPVLERPIIGQATRIRVYINDAWALPLSDVTGRFRDCSSAFFRDNPTQVHRLHGFILRDLVAIRECRRLEGTPMPVPLNSDVAVANLIMRSIVLYEIRQLHILSALDPFLSGYAVHFCHELYTYANSPFDINGFDRNVQYTYPPHPPELTAPRFSDRPTQPIHVVGETIVLEDSENEEVQNPSAMEVIVLSSSTDDSDVEILSHSFRSIEALNSASIDQPSTSTGIRDSLDRPNNRYNLRRRRLLSPTVNDSSSFPMQSVCDLSRMSYPPHVRRSGPNQDSSSSDEESITDTRGTLTAHLMREARQNDKNKKKKQKNKHKKRKLNTNDSRSEIHSTNRSRSHSESSSSSEDPDIRPSNRCIRTDIIL